LTALVLVLQLLCATTSSAQRPALLQLMVVDGESGAPISGVQVAVDGGRMGALSGPEGMVELSVTAGDSVVLELRSVGYASRGLTAFPTAGQPLLITVPLELAPVPLAPVSVEIDATPRSRDVREFYARARRGVGQYITRAEIEERHLRDLNDLFRTLPGITLSNTAFGDKPMMESKTSMMPERGGGECSVQYFLDGTPISPPEGAVGFDVDLDEVEGIEIYRRGAGVPARFQRQHGSCGVILIWKRQSLAG
jgi:hypothetical protein